LADEVTGLAAGVGDHLQRCPADSVLAEQFQRGGDDAGFAALLVRGKVSLL
jgi:hypothetical protein